MTLSNIFFGKKVVQQAYLNNALIYQSKGWETLPSTCTEVWTKSYGKVDNFRSIAKDDLDNLYVGIDQYLCKIDSDGKLIWKTDLLVDKGSFKSSVIDSIILSKNSIYCTIYYSTFENSSTNWFYYLAKVNSNGNLISIVTINSVMPNENYGVKMLKNDLNIYAMSSSCLYKFDLNFKLIDYVTMSIPAKSLTTNNGPYVFVGAQGGGIRLCKDNLKNGTDLILSNSYFTADLITLDSLGNLYLGSSNNNSIYKYSVENCKLIATIFLGSNSKCYEICTDFKENFYIIYSDGTNCLLRKNSSDGTLIWDNVPIPASNNNIKVITDSNGNIYVAYIDSSSMLAIKKLINLVKKGN